MSEVSRPLQVVLVLALAFAALWFVALRPKHGGGSPATPSPARQPAQPAAPKKSSLPGGLGRAVDKANATKRQGDAAAAATDRAGAAPEDASSAPGSAPTPAAPSSAAPAAPANPAQRIGQAVGGSSGNVAANAGAVAMGMFGAAFAGTAGASAGTPVPATVPAGGRHTVRHHGAGVTAGMVRRALARGDAVVLLFWTSNSSDDRAVHAELPRVDRRGGRVQAWAVSVRGLSRFKTVLRGIDVVESPSVVVLARGAQPRLLAGYTDHAQIDQATLLALTRG
jgi:hypothetical protein